MTVLKKLSTLKFIFLFTLSMFFSGITPAIALDCKQDTLIENSQGEILQTLSGEIYETLGGDSVTANLWLPMSDLIICGPQFFEYKGQNYGIFNIKNNDDEEEISALAINKEENSASNRSPCYNSTITEPTPFMGNNDEIFHLADGTVWQIKYEYEYMYEYYPNVVACPSDGYVIVEGEKLNAQIIK